jgi:hypothetical protein
MHRLAARVMQTTVGGVREGEAISAFEQGGCAGGQLL